MFSSILNYFKLLFVPQAGLKPATLGLEIPCSFQLSYWGLHLMIIHQVILLIVYMPYLLLL